MQSMNTKNPYAKFVVNGCSLTTILSVCEFPSCKQGKLRAVQAGKRAADESFILRETWKVGRSMAQEQKLLFTEVDFVSIAVDCRGGVCKRVNPEDAG